jgi:hypothetical protein
MSNDTVYRLMLDLSLKGDLNKSAKESVGHLVGIQHAFQHAGSAAASAAGAISNAFTGAVEKVGLLTAGLAAAAAYGGLAMLKEGVVGINAELEKTQISLAAAFSANGLSGNMSQGMGDASRIMSKMREDAAALPGEYEDLLGIFRMMAVPGARAGMGINQMEKLSANVMAGGAVAGMPMDQVAREMAQLVEGRAGSHNVLGSRLFGLAGKEATAFNKLDDGARIKALETKFGAYKESIDFFSTSYDAMIGELKSTVKGIKGDLTRPLFEEVKKTIAEINGWFKGGGAASVAYYTHRLGIGIADAFSRGVEIMKEWGPFMKSFVLEGYNRFAQMWDHITPLIERVAHGMRGITANQAWDKIAHVASIYAAVKGGGMVLGAASSIGGPLASLAGAAGSSGALSTLASVFANPAGIAVAGAGLATLVLTAVAAYGAFSALTDETSYFHGTAVSMWGDIKDSGVSALQHLHGAMVSLEPAVKFTAEALGTVLLANLRVSASAIEEFASALEFFASNARGAIEGLISWHKGNGPKLGADEAPTYKERETTPDFARMAAAAASANEDTANKVKSRHPGGHGSTNVQKVEIVISSNQDPSRIAHLAMEALLNLKRHPKMSANVPNWSGAPRL